MLRTLHKAGMGGPRESARFGEIDVFRGIAALWVVYYHYVFRSRVLYELPAASSLPGRSASIEPAGFVWTVPGEK
nr:hypothetical protein MTCCP1_00075 [uncultured bacterium]